MVGILKIRASETSIWMFHFPFLFFFQNDFFTVIPFVFVFPFLCFEGITRGYDIFHGELLGGGVIVQATPDPKVFFFFFGGGDT